jgi:hypothetical protein
MAVGTSLSPPQIASPQSWRALCCPEDDMPGTVYRSKGHDPLRERLIDAGIGTVLGMLTALILGAMTLGWVFG